MKIDIHSKRNKSLLNTKKKESKQENTDKLTQRKRNKNEYKIKHSFNKIIQLNVNIKNLTVKKILRKNKMNTHTHNKKKESMMRMVWPKNECFNTRIFERREMAS